MDMHVDSSFPEESYQDQAVKEFSQRYQANNNGCTERNTRTG